MTEPTSERIEQLERIREAAEKVRLTPPTALVREIELGLDGPLTTLFDLLGGWPDDDI